MVRSGEIFKSLQIYRPVIVDQLLGRFLVSVNQIGLEVFPPESSVLVDSSFDLNSFENITRNIDETGLDLPKYVTALSLGVGRHKLYDAEQLKVPLLDIRMPRSDYNKLQRAFTRISPDVQPKTKRKPQVTPRSITWPTEFQQAALRYDIPDNSELDLSFTGLVFMVNPGYESKGREMSLLPEPPSAENLLMLEEIEIGYRALQAANPDLAKPISKSTIELPFIRLPVDAKQEEIRDFTNRVQSLLPVSVKLGAPGVDL